MLDYPLAFLPWYLGGTIDEITEFGNVQSGKARVDKKGLHVARTRVMDHAKLRCYRFGHWKRRL